MSNAIITRAYESTVTDPTDISVLVALADQANDDGICWPSVGSVSRRTRLHDRTVQRSLRRLVADGQISVTGAVAGGFERQTPTYVVHPRLPMTGGAESPVAQRHPGGTAPPPRWHSATPPVAQSHPPGGTAPPPRWHSATQTLIEPKENPQGTLNADASARMQAPEGTSVLLDVDPLPKKKKGGAGALTVEWDGTAFRVPAELLAQWRAAFPALNVVGCIREAAMWVIDHPARSRKKPGARFLEAWLKRTRVCDSPQAADDADPLPPAVVQDDGPEGWQAAYEAMYDHEPDRPWPLQISAVQSECRQWVKKRERGAA
jgi:hypothetical protein